VPLLAFLPLLGLNAQRGRWPQPQAFQADGLASDLAPSVLAPCTDGVSYPDVTLDVSSASHPIHTGQERKAKAESRVAGFNKRFAGFTAK